MCFCLEMLGTMLRFTVRLNSSPKIKIYYFENSIVRVGHPFLMVFFQTKCGRGYAFESNKSIIILTWIFEKKRTCIDYDVVCVFLMKLAFKSYLVITIVKINRLVLR